MMNDTEAGKNKLSGYRKVSFHSLHMFCKRFLSTSFSEFKFKSIHLFKLQTFTSYLVSPPRSKLRRQTLPESFLSPLRTFYYKGGRAGRRGRGRGRASGHAGVRAAGRAGGRAGVRAGGRARLCACGCASACPLVRVRVRMCMCVCVFEAEVARLFTSCPQRTPVWQCVCAGVRSCANRRFCFAKSLRIRAVPPRALAKPVSFESMVHSGVKRSDPKTNPNDCCHRSAWDRGPGAAGPAVAVLHNVVDTVGSFV